MTTKLKEMSCTIPNYLYQKKFKSKNMTFKQTIKFYGSVNKKFLEFYLT